MGPSIESMQNAISSLIKDLEYLPESEKKNPRELALVKTKLQEASLWLTQAQ